MNNIKRFEAYYGLDPLEIIKKYKLDDYLKTVLTESKSNNAPYHNINHVLCMVKNTYIIGQVEGLGKNEIRTLVISALFHDFNHSEGKKSDDENIKTAIKAVKKYILEKDKDIEDDIINIIKATEYPYVIEDKDLDMSQKVIRDSDMLQTLEDNFVHQILFGLSKELGIEFKKFLDIQLNFIDNLKLYTKSAKEMSKGKFTKIKKDVKYLKSIL